MWDECSTMIEFILLGVLFGGLGIIAPMYLGKYLALREFEK